MDITPEQMIIILEKLKINGGSGTITTEAKDDIRTYLQTQVGVSPSPSAPDGIQGAIPDGTDSNSTGYQDPAQTAKNSLNERLALWANHSISYKDVKEWYHMAENETKKIPNKSQGNGFCPCDGLHFDINTNTQHYGKPGKIPTGSLSKLVCTAHQPLLSKRDQTREIMAYANTNSTVFDRKNKTWKIGDFPENLRNRIIMCLENRGETPDPVIQVYNQTPSAQVQNSNPLGLQLGQPGVIVCANCKGLANHAAETCPSCGQSPTTGLQKITSFAGGLVGLGATIAKTQITGNINAQMANIPKYCPRCATQNPGTSLICSSCGSSLNPQTMNQQQPQNQYGQAPQY
jgi:hypothetical protein